MIAHQERRSVQLFQKKLEIKYASKKLKTKVSFNQYHIQDIHRERGKSNSLKYKFRNERFCDFLDDIDFY